MDNVIKNIILVTLTKAKLNKERLSTVTGINKKELEIYLNKLIEEKAIKKEGDIYSLAENGKAEK